MTTEEQSEIKKLIPLLFSYFYPSVKQEKSMFEKRMAIIYILNKLK